MSETVAATPHELLLALAGWVDDDLLATGRELVAVGEEVPALELLVATLAAGRTALPSPVREALVGTASAMRVLPHADRALAPGVPPGETTHRFAAEAGPADVAVRVAGIGTNLPVVARSGARVSLVWRLTPAGAAPGPLPHPVLLAAVPDDGPVEVLAYQLGAALTRAGVPASVEAFVDGATLPPYHLAALSEALPLDPAATDADPAAPGVVQPDTPSSRPAVAPGHPVDDAPEVSTPPHGMPRHTGPDTGVTTAPDTNGSDPGGPDLPGPDGPAPATPGPDTPGPDAPGPVPGAGPFDDGRLRDPGPAAQHPAPPPSGDGTPPGPRTTPVDDPRPGAGVNPAGGHPAPRPAPRRIVPVPESPQWFAEPSAGQGPAVDGEPTPANGSPPVGGAHAVAPTGPISLPPAGDALDGPLDPPLPGPRPDDGEDSGTDGPGAGDLHPGGEAWERDWSTGAWSTAGPGTEPVTGPTPATGPSDGSQDTRPRLRSVSGPPPILRAPAPPAPAPSAPAARPHDPGPEAAGSAVPSMPPQDAGPTRPRHRLDVPDSPDPAGSTPGAAEEPDGSSHPEAADEDPERHSPDAPPAAPAGDRDTEARNQHPASQQAPEPGRNGRRPTSRPRSRGDAHRPAPGPDLGGRLTPNEQELLRRLQEELAARDDDSSEQGPRNGSAHPDGS